MNKTTESWILTAKGVRKSYPSAHSQQLEVLKGIDFRLRAGEIVAVIGPSGVGKSTLLHILGTLDRPTAGTVQIENNDVFSLGDAGLSAFRNQKIGFVFQFHHLLPDFTALENVAIPGFIARRNPSEVIDYAKVLLNDVGLGSRLNHRPRELSGGEQQRVAFARALINDPIVILADEPSGNLDYANSLALNDLMWKIVKETGKSFIVATHNQMLASQADRVIELFDGQVKS